MNVNRWVVDKLMPCDTRYMIVQGGAGSGKSVGCAQKLLIRASTTKHRFLICRKVARTLKKSVFQLFKDLIYAEDKSQFYRFNHSELIIFDEISGSEFHFAGLDDVEKLKSIQGITGVWYEEATESDDDSGDFDQLELRIRGKDLPDYAQFILSYNPVSDQNWIYNRFFTREDPEVTVLKTNYLDNAFLDDDYINHLTNRVSHDENLYRIYVLGEWGRIKTGGEFYKHFDETKHTGDTRYNEGLPLHISFDENVNPYITLTIWQFEKVGDSMICNQIDEFCLETPRNTLSYLCADFLKKYGTHEAGIYIYGDSTSKKQDTKLEKGYNFYTIIEGKLANLNPIRRVPSKNPPVVTRGQFINAIFGSGYNGIQITIGKQCVKSVADLLHLLESPEGGKHKHKVRDKSTGVSYEKYGHTSDCLDYVICEVLKQDYYSYIRPQKEFDHYEVGAKSFNSSKRY
jgi:PBSX family phage terminase large subunit